MFLLPSPSREPFLATSGVAAEMTTYRDQVGRELRPPLGRGMLGGSLGPALGSRSFPRGPASAPGPTLYVRGPPRPVPPSSPPLSPPWRPPQPSWRGRRLPTRSWIGPSRNPASPAGVRGGRVGEKGESWYEGRDSGAAPGGFTVSSAPEPLALGEQQAPESHLSRALPPLLPGPRRLLPQAAILETLCSQMSRAKAASG